MIRCFISYLEQNTLTMQTRDRHHTASLDLSISGMSCASCVAQVEKALNKLPEVDSATVNLATERAHVVLRKETPAERIAQAVLDAGYGAEVISAYSRKQTKVQTGGWQVALAVALSLPLVLPMFFSLFGLHVMPPGWLQ